MKNYSTAGTNRRHSTRLPKIGGQWRKMKGPEDHGINGGENNGGGAGVNLGEGGNVGIPGNNDGKAFDPATFWNEPEPSGVPAPQSGGSAADSQGGSGPTLGDTLNGRITSFEVRDIFTPAILEEMGDGNFENVHKGFQTAIQSAMTTQMQNTTELLSAFGASLVNKMQTMIQGNMQVSDQKKALYEAIPSAQSPKVGPVVERLYERAIEIAKGDTKAAIEMTKEMLKTVSSETGRDTGLRVAPLSGDSEPGGNIPTNWTESLMSPSR